LSAKSILIVTTSIFGSAFLGIFLSTIIFDGPSPDSEEFFENERFSQTRSEATKVDPLILEWQSSSNPEAFARINNLSFSDDKIAAYIYLDNADSISNIPSEIDVISSDDNIVVAFVSSQQIEQLAQMVFVERIAPPILAVFRQDSTIPLIESPAEKEKPETIIESPAEKEKPETQDSKSTESNLEVILSSSTSIELEVTIITSSSTGVE